MKRLFHTYLSSLYMRPRLFAALAAASILHLFAYFLPWLGAIPSVFTIAVAVAALSDYLLLFGVREGMQGVRRTPERLSNGDANPITVEVRNRYRFPVDATVIDELPFQFQERGFGLSERIPAQSARSFTYSLRPTKRGEYDFGAVNVYAAGPVGLLERRYSFSQGRTLPVYPSFLQMRRYQLLAVSNRLSQVGVRRVRRIGHSMEFEQIREYVPGDDARTVNWKATARRRQMMVNSFIEERSQSVYCLIDKGRVMRMPFDGLSLLDHAVNAAVVLSNIALARQDKAGIITFSDDIGDFLPSSGRPAHMQAILEVLHRQRTRYMESDYEKLYALVRRRVTQRSLMLLFTNFESVDALHRQLPYLRAIAANHLLLVVFFENPQLTEQASRPANTLEQVYLQTVSEKFVFEKRLIVRELQRHGILSLLTPPEELTVQTINRYVELKARQAI